MAKGDVLYFGLGLTVLGWVITLIALCSPFHKQTVFAQGIVVFKLDTFTLRANVEANKLLCSMMTWSPFSSSSDEQCAQLSAAHDLQDLSQRFCGDPWNGFMPQACWGLKNAYGLGLGLILLSVLNFVVQGIAAWLIWQYLDGAPKQRNREIAAHLMAGGTCVIFLLVVLYIPMVLAKLDQVTLTGASGSVGTAFGYFLMWVSLLINTVVVILYLNGKSSDERRYAEAREAAKFENEMAYMTGAYNNNNRGMYPQPGSGQMMQSNPGSGQMMQSNPGYGGGGMQQQPQFHGSVPGQGGYNAQMGQMAYNNRAPPAQWSGGGGGMGNWGGGGGVRGSISGPMQPQMGGQMGSGQYQMNQMGGPPRGSGFYR